MAYRLPTFNLTVNVWRNGVNHANPPAFTVMGNFNLGRRVAFLPTPLAQVVSWLWIRYLLVPTGTDLRGLLQATGKDQVEVPAGSGRYFDVWDVEYVGEGFANQHLRAALASHQVQPNF